MFLVELTDLLHVVLLVSTYLFVRCNNHKCVNTPLWRGYFTWSWLDHVSWAFMSDVMSCSWLILVQVPSLYHWLWEFFTLVCHRSCWTLLLDSKLDTVRQVVAVNVLLLQGPSVCGLNLLEWPSPLPFAANCALQDSFQALHLFCGFCCGDYL